MKLLSLGRQLRQLTQQEDLNFLLTNRVPRIALTRFMGWFSQIRSPALARLSIAVWRLFTDLDLSEAKQQRFGSLRGGTVFQAKGFPYEMAELFGPTQDTAPFQGGAFVTLRLTSAMYHRFHAPADAELQHVTHLRGDTWNVNPIALKRVERLFCRNERAVLRLRLDQGGHPIALVPVAAILVASLRLHAVNLLLHGRYRGPDEIACRAPVKKGQELGWFQHGSTIIVFVPPGFALAEGIATGARIRMGQPLMRLPAG
jgi:phosphatidylserine decarboxylase